MKRSSIFCSSILRSAILVTLGACAVLPACSDDPADTGSNDTLDLEAAPTARAVLPEPELDALALGHLTRRMALDASSVRQLGAVTTRLSATGRVIREMKVENLRDGTIAGIAVDERGQEVDTVALQREEEAARASIERRADAPLAALLEEAASDDLIEVTIWLNAPAADLPERPGQDSRPTRRDRDRLREEVRSRRAAQVRAVAEPVHERLARLGFAAEADEHAPILRATLPASVVEEFRSWEEIDRMYLPVQVENAMYSERLAIYAHWVHSRGFAGGLEPVAVVEVGGQIDTANPFLSGITQDTTFSCLHPHAAAVSGMIRSTDGVETGIAPGANLWIGGSCGGHSAELEDRSNAAAAWGARAFNLSFGGYESGNLSSLDRFYDNLVFNQWRTVVPAAGNAGNTGYVATPGTAYNVITVGSFDEATGAISSFSSGVDPVSAHADREKPEVAAPGENVVSTINGIPWLGNTGSGTSYAAPMVTGTAALMMDRLSSLEFWPEAVRAIIMASATHNIEGATRLSELDGAGGIYSDHADDIVSGLRGSWRGLGYTCASGATTQAATAYFNAGVNTRVVLSWNTDPSYASYTSLPSADLDLVVKDPNGAIVASSASWDNTYEIVEFIAPVAGNYSIEVSKYRCDLSPRYAAVAWFQ